MQFTLTVTEPPASSSGTVYPTVEARCRACVILGGEEEPCQPPHMLELERQATGHPCPRRTLDFRDAPTAELFFLSVDPRLRHLWPDYFRVMFGSAPRAEQLSTLRRVRLATSDPRIRESLPQPLEQSLPALVASLAGSQIGR